MSPEQATALISAVGALVVAAAGLLGGVLALLQQAKETHTLVNSRMTELLDITKSAALARGRLEGATIPPEDLAAPDRRD